MNQVTRRTILQSGGLLGGRLALDAASPASDATRPAATVRSAGAIDAVLDGGVARDNLADVVAMVATRDGLVYEAPRGKSNVAVRR